MSGERYTGKEQTEQTSLECVGLKDEIRALSAQLTVAREALEKINREEPTPKCDDPHCWPCSMWQIAASALSQILGIKDADVSTDNPSPTESASIPEHGDFTP